MALSEQDKAQVQGQIKKATGMQKQYLLALIQLTNEDENAENTLEKILEELSFTKSRIQALLGKGQAGSPSQTEEERKQHRKDLLEACQEAANERLEALKDRSRVTMFQDYFEQHNLKKSEEEISIHIESGLIVPEQFAAIAEQAFSEETLNKLEAQDDLRIFKIANKNGDKLIRKTEKVEENKYNVSYELQTKLDLDEAIKILARACLADHLLQHDGFTAENINNPEKLANLPHFTVHGIQPNTDDAKQMVFDTLTELGVQHFTVPGISQPPVNKAMAITEGHAEEEQPIQSKNIFQRLFRK